MAEHLPASRASGFVHDLCAASDFVLFSAAIPGQGGQHHVNEQWPGYWADRFAAEGYAITGALRFRFWNTAGVEPWYRQNLLLAGRDPVPDDLWGLFHGEGSDPLPLVHPLYWRERVLGEKV